MNEHTSISVAPSYSLMYPKYAVRGSLISLEKP